MRLDRNIGGRNKYGLIKNRELDKLRDRSGHLPEPITDALLVLLRAGVLDWGGTPETEFFVIRLKDAHARPALVGYANDAMMTDQEYARDVIQLADRSSSGNPHCKAPD